MGKSATMLILILLAQPVLIMRAEAAPSARVALRPDKEELVKMIGHWMSCYMDAERASKRLYNGVVPFNSEDLAQYIIDHWGEPEDIKKCGGNK